jgi:hypothetical protein
MIAYSIFMWMKTCVSLFICASWCRTIVVAIVESGEAVGRGRRLTGAGGGVRISFVDFSVR